MAIKIKKNKNKRGRASSKGAPPVSADEKRLRHIEHRLHALDTIVSVNDDAYPLPDGVEVMSVTHVLAAEIGVEPQHVARFKDWLKAEFYTSLEGD